MTYQREFDLLDDETLYVLFYVNLLIFFLFFISFYRFNERGKIFSTEEVKVMHAGPSDIFFTGDGAGKVNMWKWSTVDKCSPWELDQDFLIFM